MKKNNFELALESMPTMQEASENLAKAMGVSVDQQFFLQTDYQKKHRTLWERFIDWKHEIEGRIDTAIEVLQGKHYCGD